MTYFLDALLIFVLYYLVVRFIIPVYRTGKQMKQQFDDMKERFGDTTQNGQNVQTPSQNNENVNKADYIEFEEVKD
jgi:hypothetical protein